MTMPDDDPFSAARRHMVETQLRPRGIACAKVLDLMGDLPRHLFLSEAYRQDAYEDQALPSRAGQTISQPFMVAIMTQELQLAAHHRVLELGTGTGYQTALLARLVPAGCVYTIERLAPLTAFAAETLASLDIHNVRYFTGDGSAGWPEDYWDQEGPILFDRILITAGSPEVPAPLLAQLREGGLMIVPLGGRDLQTLIRVEKHPGRTSQTRLLDCRFVPLLGAHAWPTP
jgi:protein-L-isoaspartate(D-aspartate) O-methyltransferase